MAAMQGQLPRRDLDHFLAVLGASVVVLSVAGAGEQPVCARWCALGGFLLWLLAVARLLLLPPLFTGAIVTAVERLMKCFLLLGRLVLSSKAGSQAPSNGDTN
ncbi:hypothetical protein BS78_09G227200 [Paspalum vaginatum]|nr:hypothetical protein BS78_09G227200 [Paspalum vaginatum]